ncbi:MAG TPA: DUF3887 domain-containing protein [Dehalococcoidia bacterium]|nr:DUF3887 domain-containing protein [Dehalococcoidia bacterium]
MKPIFLSLAVVAAMALPATQVFAGSCGGGGIDTPDILASHVVYDMGVGDFNFVESNFDTNLSAALPPAVLANAWQSYDQQLGAVRSQGEPIVESQGALTVVQVSVQFANGKGLVRVAVNNADMTIDALSFLPAAS